MSLVQHVCNTDESVSSRGDNVLLECYATVLVVPLRTVTSLDMSQRRMESKIVRTLPVLKSAAVSSDFDGKYSSSRKSASKHVQDHFPN